MIEFMHINAVAALWIFHARTEFIILFTMHILHIHAHTHARTKRIESSSAVDQ